MVNVSYKRIYVLRKSAYIQLIRVRLCIRFSVPIKRGRQVTMRPSYLDIGMGGYFERFGGRKKEASTEIEALLMLLQP